MHMPREQQAWKRHICGVLTKPDVGTSKATTTQDVHNMPTWSAGTAATCRTWGTQALPRYLCSGTNHHKADPTVLLGSTGLQEVLQTQQSASRWSQVSSPLLVPTNNAVQYGCVVLLVLFPHRMSAALSSASPFPHLRPGHPAHAFSLLYAPACSGGLVYTGGGGSGRDTLQCAQDQNRRPQTCRPHCCAEQEVTEEVEHKLSWEHLVQTNHDAGPLAATMSFRIS